MKIWLHWVCTVTARRAAGAQNCETTHFAFFVKEAIFSFLAFTWSRVGPSLPPVYNPQKHKICASQITWNVGSRTQFWYGFLLSAYAMPFFSCSIAWNRTSYWHWCQSGGCSVQHLPDITRYRLPGDCIKLLLSLFFIFRFEKTRHSLTNPCSCRLDRFAPRMSRICHLAPLCNKISWSACVVKVLDDEYFGSRPLTPLVLNFSFAVIMSKLNPIDHKSITARLLIPFSWSFSWIDWVWLSERDDKQCWDRILERTRVCV